MTCRTSTPTPISAKTPTSEPGVGNRRPATGGRGADATACSRFPYSAPLPRSPLSVPDPDDMIRILGIDPGSQRTGVGIIDIDASGRTTHVYHAPLVLLGADSFPLRLKRLLLGLAALIETYQPQEVAIEKVFMARNPDSALKLGQARGAAMSAVVLRDLPVHEYAAKEIKLAVVGKGGAQKEQVQHMVGIMLNLKGKLQADAADALAVAITHAHVRATANRLGIDARDAWSRK